LTWTAPSAGTIDLAGHLCYEQFTLEHSNDYTLTLGTSVLPSGTISYQTAYDAAPGISLNLTTWRSAEGKACHSSCNAALATARGPWRG
jgi:hypothetical protein